MGPDRPDAHTRLAAPCGASARRQRKVLPTLCRVPPGEPYDATDPELTDDRIRCRKLLHQFNQELEYDDVEGRAAVLRQLLGSLDEGGAWAWRQRLGRADMVHVSPACCELLSSNFYSHELHGSWGGSSTLLCTCPDVPSCLGEGWEWKGRVR